MFTANERGAVVGAEYELQLYADNTLKKTIALGNDLSSFPERFNLFNVAYTETNFGFTEKGVNFFDYKLLANSELVEVGICKVHVNENTSTFTSYEGTNNIFKQR